MDRETWYVGRQFGLRIDLAPGLWFSLGVHAHVWPLREAHLDLHIVWAMVTLGRHRAAGQDEPWAGKQLRECSLAEPTATEEVDDAQVLRRDDLEPSVEGQND